MASFLYVTISNKKSNLFFILFFYSSSSLSDVVFNLAFTEKKTITHHIVNNHHTKIIKMIFNRNGNFDFSDVDVDDDLVVFSCW